MQKQKKECLNGFRIYLGGIEEPMLIINIATKLASYYLSLTTSYGGE